MKRIFSILFVLALVLGLSLIMAAPAVAATTPAINHGTFGGAPYARVDASVVAAYKTEATAISAGGYVSDTEYYTMEATLISFDGGSTYATDRGGCIYIQTVISGLEAGDIVEVDNNYLYNDGSGYYSYWDQPPYWVEIGDYTHTAGDTINNWLIYGKNDGGGEYTLVIGSGEYNLALNTDDLTTIIGDSFELTRDVKVYRGETLSHPTTSSRGYTQSTNENTSGWSSPIATDSLDTGDLRYVGVHDTYVDDAWVGSSNGDIVGGHIFGQDAFETIQRGIDGVAGSTVHVAAGTYTGTVIVNVANLTLAGPNAGVNPNTATRGAEAIIAPTAAGSWPDVGAVSVRSNGVTIDGFEVDGSIASQNGINVYGASDVTVKNNIVHGLSHTWDGVGILVWDWDSAYTVDRAVIENNEVYDTGRMGIFCMDYDTANSEYDLTEGHVIRGNRVYDTWKKGDDWSDCGGGIQINVGKDCIIEHNEIFNTASSVYGTYFNAGIYMFGSGTGNIIACNTIRDNPGGATLWIAGSSPGIDWEGDVATSPDVSRNSIYDNTNYGACGFGTPVMDAEDNWWGDDSGPYHSTNPSGMGNKVSDNVDFTPWIKKSTPTTTVGNATFSSSQGNIVGLQGVTTPPNPPVTLPYGAFNFTICCLTGTSVTLNITLPGPLPVGSKWWKYYNGSWYPLDIGSDDGDNFITVALRDNIPPEDEDTVPGQITDQGAPGPGLPVGWETYPVSKGRVLLPWIGLLAAIMAGASLFGIGRRRAQD
jgi:hypothetical protein